MTPSPPVDPEAAAAVISSAVRELPAAAPLLDALAAVAPEAGVWLVGGAVRDLLLGRVPIELDLVAESDPAGLVAALGGPQRVHGRFGTCTVALDGRSYDIARARAERYPHPGALPQVTPASIDADLPRRDFTVNAIAYGLAGPRAGKILEVPGALADLGAGILRVLHPASFIDDPTRLLRMARYAGRFAFAPDPNTAALATEAIANGAADTVSGTRIGNELRALAGETDALEALRAVDRLGLGDVIAPGFRLDQAPAAGALALGPPDARADLLLTGLAFTGVRDPAARLDALGYTAADRDVIAAVAGAPRLGRHLQGAAIDDPVAIADVADRAPLEAVAAAGALGAEAQARRWLEELRHISLEITGADLIAAGLLPGPAIGRGLQAALRLKRSGHVAGREAELVAAIRAAEEPESTPL